jgi:hypothetical protein
VSVSWAPSTAELPGLPSLPPSSLCTRSHGDELLCRSACNAGRTNELGVPTRSPSRCDRDLLYMCFPKRHLLLLEILQ